MGTAFAHSPTSTITCENQRSQEDARAESPSAKCQLAQTAFEPNGSVAFTYTNYSYDAAGNRNSTGYATTLGNEMSSDGTWDYTYDAKGNITEKDLIGSSEKWTYAYDNRNELTEAKHFEKILVQCLTTPLRNCYDRQTCSAHTFRHNKDSPHVQHQVLDK